MQLHNGLAAQRFGADTPPVSALRPCCVTADHRLTRPFPTDAGSDAAILVYITVLGSAASYGEQVLASRAVGAGFFEGDAELGMPACSNRRNAHAPMTACRCFLLQCQPRQPDSAVQPDIPDAHVCSAHRVGACCTCNASAACGMWLMALQHVKMFVVCSVSD